MQSSAGEKERERKIFHMRCAQGEREEGRACGPAYYSCYNTVSVQGDIAKEAVLFLNTKIFFLMFLATY